jgi:hypothetical protein
VKVDARLAEAGPGLLLRACAAWHRVRRSRRAMNPQPFRRWRVLLDFALVMLASTLLVEIFLLLLGSGQRWG